MDRDHSIKAQTRSNCNDKKGINYIDPSEKIKHQYQDDLEHKEKEEEDADTLRRLGLKQTLAARLALYYPGPQLRLQLGLAAAQLTHLVVGLSRSMRDALSIRILGKEGLLAGGSNDDLLNALIEVAQDGVSLKNEVGSNLATSRAATIALMGDIGALFTDTGATTGTNRDSDTSNELRINVRSILEQNGLSPPGDEDIQRVRGKGGSDKVGPSKRDERIRDGELVQRSGIHDKGEEADNVMRIEIGDRIKGAAWQVAQLASSLVYGATEPLVGHMSASPSEILMVWDLLCGWEPARQYNKPRLQRLKLSPKVNPLFLPNSQARYARAAGACAMLIGVGFHSALECLQGTLYYLGQNVSEFYEQLAKEKARKSQGIPVKDAVLLFAHGAATDLLFEIFMDETDSSSRSRYRAPESVARRNSWG